MGKGVLLEMAGRQAVVLTPQGEFKKIPAPRGTWEIGDEVEFAESGGGSMWARWGATAAAAAVLMIGSFAGYNQYTLTVPVAVVTVDINPSLELTLNRKDQVLKAQPLNADGELVLQGVTWARKPFDQVVRAVTERAVEEHKLNPADETSAVLVGVAPLEKAALPADQAERIVEHARAAVSAEVTEAAKELGQEPKTSVAVLVATAAEKKEADKEGLSVGKFKMLPEIQEAAPQVEPEVLREEMKANGPGRLFKDLHIKASEIFSKAEENNEQSRPATSNAGGNKDDKDKKDDKGQGAPQEPKQADPSAGGAGQNEKPGADKKAEEEKKPGADGSPASDKKSEPDKSGNGGDKADPGKPADPGKGQPDKKAEPNRTPDTEKKDQPDKKDEPKKNDTNKGQEKKNSWTIPFLGITIEKPAFLSDNDEPQPTDVAETPAPATPRAEQPGAGASEEPKNNGSQGNGSQGNGSQGNGSQANDPKGNDAKGNSDAKGNDSKGNAAQEEPEEKQPKESPAKPDPAGKGNDKPSEKEIPKSKGKESKD